MSKPASRYGIKRNETETARYTKPLVFQGVSVVAGAGFEPATFGLWAQRATGLLHPAMSSFLASLLKKRAKIIGDHTLVNNVNGVFLARYLRSGRTLHDISLKISLRWKSPEPESGQSVNWNPQLTCPEKPFCQPSRQEGFFLNLNWKIFRYQAWMKLYKYHALYSVCNGFKSSHPESFDMVWHPRYIRLSGWVASILWQFETKVIWQ